MWDEKFLRWIADAIVECKVGHLVRRTAADRIDGGLSLGRTCARAFAPDALPLLLAKIRTVDDESARGRRVFPGALRAERAVANAGCKRRSRGPAERPHRFSRRE